MNLKIISLLHNKYKELNVLLQQPLVVQIVRGERLNYPGLGLYKSRIMEEQRKEGDGMMDHMIEHR